MPPSAYLQVLRFALPSTWMFPMANRIYAPLIVGALAVALIAGVSAWTMRSRSAEPQSVAAVSAASSAPATASVAANPATGMPGVPASPASAEDMLAMQAANEASVNTLVDAGEKKLRTRYDSEPVDAAWASRKQEALERLSASPQIQQLDAQPLAMAANCRSSVCLISADFPSYTAAEDWLTLYTLNAGPEMSNAASRRTTNPDGSINVRIYGLARQ